MGRQRGESFRAVSLVIDALGCRERLAELL